MRTITTSFFALPFVLLLTTSIATAEIQGELVGTKVIWDKASINRDTDIVRFKDRWFVVCCEKSEEFSQDAVLRIISSKDGDQWESVALLQGPIPKPSYRYDPKFTICSDGRLMVSALGMRTFAWFSDDGCTWSERNRIGHNDFEYSPDVWNKGIALKYAHGSHDGNSSTIQILSTKDGKSYQNLFQETFEFIPDDASILFDGDRAYCVVSRQAADPIPRGKGFGRQFQAGLLGTADAPYTDWKWEKIDRPLCVPNLLRLPDRRIIAAVGVNDKKDCITLCEFEPSTQKLSDFLDLSTPVEGLSQTAFHRHIVGLAHHDGHVWVSYHASHEGKLCVHLAKVKPTQK